MRFLVILLLFVSLFAKTDSSRLQLSNKMLEVMNKNGYIDKIISQMVAQEIAQNPLLSINPRVVKLFAKRYLSFKQLKPDLAKAYARELNSDELKTFTKFCDTSAGQKILLKMPRLINISSYLTNKKIQQHYPELVKSMMKR